MDANNTRRSNGTRSKRVLILASKLGYQTRGFADAAEKLGVAVQFGTDRCHKLDDPWGDAALALHFEKPRDAAEEIARAFSEDMASEKAIDAVIALGDRPTVTARMRLRRWGLPGTRQQRSKFAAASCGSARCFERRVFGCRTFFRLRCRNDWPMCWRE